MFMLCKKCERVIPENQTVCSYCGTSALDILPDTEGKRNNSQYSNRKRNRKKNKRNNITKINPSIILEDEAKTPAENPDKMPQEFKPEMEPPKPSVPEITAVPPEQPSETTSPPPQPEIIPQNPEPQRDSVVDTISDIERVSHNNELPKIDNKRKLPEASGIIYEIAEELYLKEKTESEIEALCQPPFKKVFSEKQLKQLDEQAKERARNLVSSTVTEPEPKSVPPEKREPITEINISENNQNKSITTAGAFLLQLSLFVPIVNIITAIFFSFGKTQNTNIRSYTRAFLIWCIIFMTAALVYLSIFYFTSPSNFLNTFNLLSLFKS